MQFDIQARSFALTKSLKQYVEEKLTAALSGYAKHRHFKRAVIRLSDINGPRGGEDKQCHIQVMLAGVPDVIIKSTQQDMYAAIDGATQRVGNTVVRRLGRQRRRMRSHSYSLGEESLA